MKTYIYVTTTELEWPGPIQSSGAPSGIKVFELDDSGTLELLHQYDMPGKGPAPLVITPDKKFIFASLRISRELASYEINKTDGSLTKKHSIPTKADACYLSFDKTNNFILGAYYTGGMVTVHKLKGNGEIAAEPSDCISTHAGAHYIETDSSNQFAFVPHIAGNDGPNLIYQFKFNESTGKLTKNDPYYFSPGIEFGPRHLCVHPSLDIMYSSNEQGSSVTSYNFDKEKGTLSPIDTVSTIPHDFKGENTCAQIRISADGKFIFVPNRGHNSIAVFSVDNEGKLTRVDIVPTEPIPRPINIDPSGNYFFVGSGIESRKLCVYRIDRQVGKLSLLQTIDVGGSPMWILPVNI